MNQHYPRYESDVAEEEEYETEPRRPRSSAKRYQPGDYRGAATMPVAQRSSLQRSARSGRSTNDRDDYRPDDINSAQTERLSPTWQPPVQPSKAVKPLPRQDRRRARQDERTQQHRNWFQRHHVAIGTTMCATIVLIVAGRHLFAWYSNALGDPLTYTQAAQTVTITGHHAQIVAFVGEHEHLEAVMIPESGKPQLLQGDVVPFDNPQISVTQGTNGEVTVTVQGPFNNDFFWPAQPTALIWTLPQDQKQGQK